jgi:hypothetical protein
MIVILKSVSGNKKEYLLNEKGNEKIFNSVIEAVEYLKEQNMTVKEINKLNFERVETI